MPAGEIFDLAADFGSAAGKIGSALYDTFDSEGKAFAEDWADIARGTAGEHGVHYPDAITSEVHGGLGGVSVEAGPENGPPQGGMGPGFEFGSQNQPPHLDGLRAMGPAEGRIEKAADATIGYLLP